MRVFSVGFGLLLFFTSPFSSILDVTEAAACPAGVKINDPPDFEKGCHGLWSAPSCPSGYNRIKYGDCSCFWGVCAKSYYRCEGVPSCCDGYTGEPSCNTPICTNGCNSGTCIAPNTCNCPEGYSGDSCEIAPPPSVDDLTVMSLNFACRDTLTFSSCDNCQARFDLMAEAFIDDSNYEGLPDLDSVDVILAQELGTEKENFEQINTALTARGFQYSTVDPAPTGNHDICNDPLIFDSGAQDLGSLVSGYDSGGLVTWSKYPIVDTHAQNWCAHSLPVPSGYLTTLLDVGDGRAIAVVNLHAMPEYDFGIEESAEDVRTYQFGELSGFAGELSASFYDSNIPFSVILGGDFNEDLYSRSSLDANPLCESITSSLVEQKFDSVGLNIHDACLSDDIGDPTWDPTRNDLANRFSSTGTHQAIDFLIQHSSSHAGDTPANLVSVFKRKTAWNGQFCEGDGFGGASAGTALALSDHNVVTATFQLPQGTASSDVNNALTAFNNAINSWTNDNLADDAACGQEDSICWTDADCCTKDHSWSSSGQYCNGINCEPCREVGESCGTIQFEGSQCCGYYDYTSGLGTHCEVENFQATCILKYERDHSCLWDEECQSNSCSFRGLWKYCD